jgi:hypothetical protein
MSPPAKPSGPRRLRFILIAGVALLVVLLAAWWISAHTATEYASFTRPDGNYRVVVMRRPVWPALMPGQAGDAPGEVRLYDRKGKLLHKAEIEMVQLVDQVEWGERSVRIKLVAEWELPD